MQVKDLKPINGQIIVIDDPQEEKLKSGLYMPQTRKPDSIITGTVIAVSKIKNTKGTERDPDVKPGDKVYYGWHSGAGRTFETDNDELCRIIKPEEIQAVINEEEK